MVEGFSIIKSVEEQNRFRATVEEVHSGDDLVLMVALGVDSLYKKVRARLKGVDTPDAYKAAADTEAGSIREKVRRMTDRKQCVVELHSQGRGGWIVTLYVLSSEGDEEDATNVNEALRSEGHVYEPVKTSDHGSSTQATARQAQA